MRPYLILLPLLSLFLVRVDLTDLIPLNYEVKILRIGDGDTLDVGLGTSIWRVRLLYIDAPEKGQKFLQSDRDAGDFSRRCLGQILKEQKTHHLKIRGHDTYGRILGEVDEVSEVLVGQGCAPLYPHSAFSSRREKFTFLKMLAAARQKKLGLWRHGGHLQPKLWRKISTRSVHPRLRLRAHFRRPYQLARKSEHMAN